MGNKLSVIEYKILGALLIICKPEKYTQIKQTDIAKHAGYKSTGGAITTALNTLEMKNYISTQRNKSIIHVMVLI